MTALRQYLYGLALVAAVALLSWSQYQQHQAGTARQQLAAEHLRSAQAEATRHATNASTLQAALQAERAAQAQLQAKQKQLRQAHAASLTRIKELTRENAELRDWSAQPLPAAARRLRERPAITGAAGYRDWLSSRDALLAAPGPPAQ